MAKVFKPGKGRGKPIRLPDETLSIDALDHQGRGIARSHPVTFVEGALPGEQCNVRISKSQKQVRFGFAQTILKTSQFRQQPPCTHYQHCGGCQTQYCQPDFMLSEKQKALSALIEKFTGLAESNIPWHNAISASSQHYRRKARLALDCRDKHNLKLGFRGKDGKAVVNIDDCPVLEPQLNRLISPLKALIRSISIRRHIGHITLFSGESGAQVTIRITQDLPDNDVQRISDFAHQQQCQILLEDNAHQLQPVNQVSCTAEYQLQVGQKMLTLCLQPNDFVQVNADVNQRMVQQALEWLALKEQDTCLDLFCGIGNFTLPLAFSGATVVGFEVSAEMVQRAKANALLNGMEAISFVCGDLQDRQTLEKLAGLHFNKVLLDPARAGAFEAVQQIVRNKPEMVLYVSCNPATFGRDIALLMQQGYQMAKISLLDMFPYTSHTEVMALFVQEKQ